MNYVDYSSPLVFIQNFTLVTLKYNTQFGKLKYFNFKQGRMILYMVAFL